MILVFVEHYLSEEGRSYFPTWLKEIRAALEAFQGYLSLRQLTDVQAPDRSLLELKFESLELLRIWAKSPEHDREIEKLIPYRLRKQHSQILRYPET
ncbi:MAG: hypothetical protein AAFV07_06750 [Bacteroidota bacterium]